MICFTYINVDSFCLEDLQLGSVVRNESVELLIIFVPFNRIQDVPFHLEIADEASAVTEDPMWRDVDVVKDQ